MRQIDRVGLLGLAQAATFDGDEARAETVDAGVVLVARRLIDGALATEFGPDGCDRHAIRLDAAVTAAFADKLVDDHALGRIRILAALPSATLFGGAGLIVKQNRAAGRFAQLALHRVEIITMVDLDVRGEITGRILVWLVTDHHDLGDALGSALARDVTGGDRR